MRKVLSILMLIISAFVTQAATAVIYIDPSFTGTSTGTIESPFKSVRVIMSNTEYLQKCGTTFEGSYTIGAVTNVKFGSYGNGPRPVVRCAAGQEAFRFNSSSSSVTVEGLEITAVNNAGGPLVHFRAQVSNIILRQNEIHGGTFCVRILSQNNSQLYGSGVELVNNFIHTSKDDAIYINRVHTLNIESNRVYKANQYWYPGASQTVAAGDGIQLTLCDLISIIDNLIDRSDTGNKGCLIISSSAGGMGTPPVPGNYININGNIFIMPMKTNQGGFGVYIGDLPEGLTVDFTFNTIISNAPEFSGVIFRNRGRINSNGNIYLCSPGIGISPNTIKYTSTDDYFKDKNLTISGGTEQK